MSMIPVFRPEGGDGLSSKVAQTSWRIRVVDWGIDPKGVSELNAVAQARRFSARESELFVLAVTGGGANADIPLWDLLTIAFALGWLTSKGRYGPRDAALNCLLDQTEAPLLGLRRGQEIAVDAAGARIVGGPRGLDVTFAGDDGSATRSFAWSRVKMCLGLGDFLFMSASPKQGQPDGMSSLNVALDAVFGSRVFDQQLLKRGIQEPARFMRAWRRRYLPLQAFAELVRHREAFLAERSRTQANRDLDADDVLALWSFSRARGATWPYARFLEKLASLVREERQSAGRRSFMDAASLDDLAGHEPFHNPEDAILEWLDLSRAQISAGIEPSPAPEARLPKPANDAGLPADNPYVEEDGPELAEERSVLALMQLPENPKFLTGEQRQQIANVLCLQPVAYDLPLALLRAQATREWENRLVEATRRAAGSGRAGVNTAAPVFDYKTELETIGEHAERAGQLVQVGFALGAPGAIRPDRELGLAVLKKLQRDRASFRLEQTELAQIFTEVQGPLLTVSRALQQITRRGDAFAARTDLARQARIDQGAFATILSQPGAAES